MNDSGELRRIDWRGVFPFLRIFSAVPRAFGTPCMALGLAFVLSCYLGGRTLDYVWTATGQGGYAERDPSGRITRSELDVFAASRSAYNDFRTLATQPAAPSVLRGPFDLLLNYEMVCFSNAARDAATGQFFPLISNCGSAGIGLVWLVSTHFVYAVLFLTLVILANALFGGAICRIAAVHSTRSRWLGPFDALQQFALPNWFSLASAPAMFILFGSALGLVLFVLGLIGAIPGIGPIFVGLTFILALLIGVGLAFAIVGLIFAAPLGAPAMAVERADAFEGYTRPCQYIWLRPLSFVLYSVTALFAGGLAYSAVRLVAALALQMTHGFLGAGMSWFGAWRGGAAGAVPALDALWSLPAFSVLPTGEGRHWWGEFAPVELHWYESTGVFFIMLLVYGLVGIVAAYGVSFFHCALTEIYLLMRHDVDGTEFSEIEYSNPDEYGLAAAAEPNGASTALPIVGQK